MWFMIKQGGSLVGSIERQRSMPVEWQQLPIDYSGKAWRRRSDLNGGACGCERALLVLEEERRRRVSRGGN